MDAERTSASGYDASGELVINTFAQPVAQEGDAGAADALSDPEKIKLFSLGYDGSVAFGGAPVPDFTPENSIEVSVINLINKSLIPVYNEIETNLQSFLNTNSALLNEYIPIWPQEGASQAQEPEATGDPQDPTLVPETGTGITVDG